MKEFLDRVSGDGLTGRKVIIHENGSREYVFLESADEPVQQGTPLNREALMAMQGFESVNTEFDTDEGDIVETNSKGEKLITRFKSDTVIEETFVGNKRITKITTFKSDGSISEVVTDGDMERT